MEMLSKGQYAQKKNILMDRLAKFKKNLYYKNYNTVAGIIFSSGLIKHLISTFTTSLAQSCKHRPQTQLQ